MSRSRVRGSLLGCALAATLAMGCEGSSPFGPNADQGIELQALLGPTCPVESEEDPCEDVPYQAWIQVRDQRGLLVSRRQTDSEGRLRVGLFPGLYVVHPESGDPFPTASEQEVTVFRDHFTPVTVHFDSGIR